MRETTRKKSQRHLHINREHCHVVEFNSLIVIIVNVELGLQARRYDERGCSASNCENKVKVRVSIDNILIITMMLMYCR